MSHDYTPNVPDPDQHRGGQPARAELVDRDAGVRERVADVAMFEVTGPRRYPTTCRVQLFTAANLRPVVVATQLPEEGPSLVNVGFDERPHPDPDLECGLMPAGRPRFALSQGQQRGTAGLAW